MTTTPENTTCCQQQPVLVDVDMAAIDERRERQAAALLAVMTAARNVSDNVGTPGASLRRIELGDALDNLLSYDPVTAVVVAAALWADRYGSAGAPRYLSDLHDVVEAAYPAPRDEVAVLVVSGPGCSCQH